MKMPAPNRAFTLLELLVAVTITLLIAGLMLSVTSGTLALWRRSQSANTQAITAKRVFALLEQDLQAAVHRREAGHWLAVDIIDTPAGLANHGWLVAAARMKPAAGGSLVPLPPADAQGKIHLTAARFGLSGSWLRLVTTHVESGGSLPTVVAYQIARRPFTGAPVAANPGPARYSLYRSVVGNEVTLANGYDVTAAGYASASNTPPAASNAFREARNVMNPSHANLLAPNVVDFGVWLRVRNPDGSLRLIHPAAAGDTSHRAVGNSTTFDSRYPEVADVMIRIMTEEGMMLLQALETNRVAARPPEYATDAEWWWGVVAANSRTFTRRIEIKGGAL
jgi:prepilin-type N-terminal cleavage/methylation domain-containing protein